MEQTKDLLTTLLHCFVSHPWAYNQLQVVFFLRHFNRRLRPHLASAGYKTVLDVGAGTGLVVRILPKTVRYIWYDNDPQKLKGFKPGVLAHYLVLGDGAQTCLKDHSVDWALCMAMSHHLTDEQLPLLISELARVVRQRLIFLIPLKAPIPSSAGWCSATTGGPTGVRRMRYARPLANGSRLNTKSVSRHINFPSSCASANPVGNQLTMPQALTKAAISRPR